MTMFKPRDLVRHEDRGLATVVAKQNGSVVLIQLKSGQQFLASVHKLTMEAIA